MSADNPLLLTCISAEQDLALLPHFLSHYLALGILPDRIRPMLNAVDADAPGLKAAQDILSRHGVNAAEIWIAPYTSDAMWAKRRELQRREAGPQDWVISADVDELHEYPEPLAQLLARCEQLGVDCIQGVFIDRLSLDGRLAAVAAEPSLMEQFPIQADVIWALGGQGVTHGRTGTVKLMAVRAHVLPNRGGHYPVPGAPVNYLYRHHLGGYPGIQRPAFRFAVPTRVHHFHWTQSLPQRLQRRLATPGVSPAGKEYGQKQLTHIAEHDGIDMTRVPTDEGGPRADWPEQLAKLRTEGRLRAGWEATGRRLRALAGAMLGRPPR